MIKGGTTTSWSVSWAASNSRMWLHGDGTASTSAPTIAQAISADVRKDDAFVVALRTQITAGDLGANDWNADGAVIRVAGTYGNPESGVIEAGFEQGLMPNGAGESPVYAASGTDTTPDASSHSLQQTGVNRFVPLNGDSQAWGGPFWFLSNVDLFQGRFPLGGLGTIYYTIGFQPNTLDTPTLTLSVTTRHIHIHHGHGGVVY